MAKRKQESASDGDDAMHVIDNPWKLAIPADVFDHFAATAEMTGIGIDDLVAAALTEHYRQSMREKKKDTPSDPPLDRQRSHSRRHGGKNLDAPQLMLPLCE